ncbi:MAG: hypothetical protein BGN83_13140 [Rhizobium sp. 63-7]|nr:MAG: hypothetical protein BGN83_13140 [Rhizobium sp. 63-7]
MKKQLQQLRLAVVTIVAVCLLVVQAAIGSFALAAAVNSPTVDFYGNPLCIESVRGDDGDTGHVALPDCCTVSCSMHVGLALPAESANFLINPLVVSSGIVQERYVTAPRITLDYLPAHPRAPPVAA